MADFKNLSSANFQLYNGPKSSAEALYWQAFSFPVTIQETAAITSVNFSPADPRLFVSTCSTKVQMYSAPTSQVHRCFSTFKTAAYGGCFRADGKLIAAGGDEGRIRIFDVDSRATLRTLNGHKAPVHKCNFTLDSVQMVSCSDDKNVVVWDIPGESSLTIYSEHNDYVRAGATSKASKDILISGSYDHQVKLYDSRTKKSVLTVDHGAPVESVLMFPNGNAFISAGGEEIRIWDAIGGGRLIGKLSQHHKTITCLSFATNGRRLLSGSLDKHVKIYDMMTCNVIHTLDYPSPILSLGIPDDDSVLVVGMVDGLLSIQNRQEKKTRPGKSPFVSRLSDTVLRKTDNLVIVKKDKIARMQKHDEFLRKFEVSRALDHVIKENIRKEPHVAMAVIQELIRRGALRAAMAAKPRNKLFEIISFILTHIGNPNYTRVLLDFANMLFDLYGQDLAEMNQRLVTRLQQKITRQLDTMKEMMQLKGAVELLLAASNTREMPPQVLQQNAKESLPSET